MCDITTQKAALRAFLAFPCSDEKAPGGGGVGFWRRVGPPGWIDPPAVASDQRRALLLFRDALPNFRKRAQPYGVVHDQGFASFSLVQSLVDQK